jgi:hypothetical protein
MTANQVKELVTKAGEVIPPDGDWMPVLFIESPNGIEIIGIRDVFTWNTTEEANLKRAQFCDFVINTLRTKKATSACFVNSVWMVFADAADKEGFEQAMAMGEAHTLGEHPAKGEAVACVLGNRGGIEDGNQVLIGRVVRHKNAHPTLKWEETRSESFGGRFPEAIEKGLNW